ncbi:NADH-quinone oxidoreductase subunit E [Histidinibacterium lentulum]|uniref:NADH-quinone oxidoreductase subunit E n=1 Tax=Histidinibacterium lentulum TaxID=2480588 RepID=A0A3N2QU02_9RHOB|nr:NADH-quinone oxidoreductase subunit E [Histidinibacterium lentulum]ROT98525.1 NADH-quinone oxidoreductase subunit E [Histidinibacterium lentulum]
MLRRLHQEQPDSFAFTPENRAWAEAQITKYPEGRQASAIIPLLWRAQEQEGWLSRPAIEHVADMLGMAHIRALEVATFYFMFQLSPVGSVAHVQVCGTLSCMICGAEDLVAVCKERIAPEAHMLSADGKFSWEEVECLGACANAPMAQIGKDYYEDLTAERLAWLLDEMAAGRVPAPGPQNGRYASEPASGLTSLGQWNEGRMAHNASVGLALEKGDTIARIDGTEEPLRAPWGDQGARAEGGRVRDDLMGPRGPDGPHPQAGRVPGEAPPPRDRGEASDKVSEAPGEAPDAEATGRPPENVQPADDSTSESLASPTAEAPPAAAPPSGVPETPPALFDSPPTTGTDDLKRIKGVGPQLEGMLNALGIYRFDQIAEWGPKEIAWVDSRLTFKGRIERDDWVSQARAFATES